MSLINNISADSPGGYANKIIANVSNLEIIAHINWQINGWNSSGAMKTCGIGIAAYEGVGDINYPADSSPFYAFGCWAYEAQFETHPRVWIGSDVYAPAVLSDQFTETEYIVDWDYNVAHTSQITITVGPDLGGGSHDITMHMVCGAFDETYTVYGVTFTSGQALIMLAGNFVISDVNHNSMSCDSLTVSP
jgi:hypothetical protein